MRRKARFVRNDGRSRLSLCEPVEDAVPGAGERERPGMPAAKTERGGGELDVGEGNVVRLAADEAGELRAEPSGRGNAVAREARGEVHVVNFSRVRHDVKSEIKRAAPDKFDPGIAQLRVNVDHAAAENFRALAHGVLCFGEKGGAASEEQAIVRRQA